MSFTYLFTYHLTRTSSCQRQVLKLTVTPAVMGSPVQLGANWESGRGQREGSCCPLLRRYEEPGKGRQRATAGCQQRTRTSDLVEPFSSSYFVKFLHVSETQFSYLKSSHLSPTYVAVDGAELIHEKA